MRQARASAASGIWLAIERLHHGFLKIMVWKRSGIIIAIKAEQLRSPNPWQQT